MTESSELNAQQVADYLQQYPDFFNQYSQLLESLAVPHPDGDNVVSLTAKQLEVFRNKQQQLQQQLHSLIAIAKENELCASRMHKLTLALLSSSTIEEAITALNKSLTDCFLIDFVALKIVAHNENAALDAFFITSEDEDLAYLTPELVRKKPRCGVLTPEQNQFFFAEAAAQVKSVASIPILFSEVTALLVLGSREEDRFHSKMGDLFLTQLSEIIAMRLITLFKLV